MPELGSLVEEAKKYTDDPKVKKLLEEVMEFEKGYPYSFKQEIRSMLSEIVGETNENR